MRISSIVLLVLTLAPVRFYGNQPERGEAITTLSTAIRKRVAAACFEVVIPRPEQDSLRYEKELPWDQVPFHIRNDKYLSIGTAFAVSRTELVTAFHVLDLTQEYLSYPTYFIRGADQKVHELDQILAAHEQKDVVRFTVKGRVFDQWLDLDPRYELNSSVFSVGNALGEGIVIRRGDLVGTLPEPVDGAWTLLKSSAEVNSGNSGGPLLNGEGRVVGVVLQRKDNLCYSLPVAEFLALKPSSLVFANKVIYGFNLFAETSKPMKSEFELQAPKGYREVKRSVQRLRHATYEQDMAALFAEQKELFPKGASSLDVIYDVPTSSFPELVFKDPKTKRWAITDVKVNSSRIGINGRLVSASTSGVSLVEIQRPDDVSYPDLIGKPRVATDLVLQGLIVSREVAGEKIRITSMGEPIRVLTHRDRLGRPWRTAIWHSEHDDQLLFICSTPTPRGLVAVIQETSSPKLETWIYDLRKIVDFLYVPYVGRLRDWGPFLSQGAEHLPLVFQGVRLDYREGKSLALHSPWVSLAVDSRTHSLSARDTLGLYMGFNLPAVGPDWELRRLVFSEDAGDNYFVLIDRPRPVPEANEDDTRRWREIAQGRHPYNKEPFTKDGRTDVAMVLPRPVSEGLPMEVSPRLATLYLARTGTVPGKTMLELIDVLVRGISLPAQRSAQVPTQGKPVLAK